MEERNDKGLYALIWRVKNDPVRGVAEVVALSLLLLYILLAFLFKAPWAHWLLIPAIPADLISIVLRIKEHRNWQIFAVSSLSFFGLIAIFLRDLGVYQGWITEARGYILFIVLVAFIWANRKDI